MNQDNSAVELRAPYRVRHSYRQAIAAEPARVFPLLCPVREVDWVPGWQPHWVITESGFAEPGCIFQTPGGSDADIAPAIWVVTRYQPECWSLEMIKVIPDHTVTRLNITLQAAPHGSTDAEVSYEFTALSAQGREFVDGCTEEWYEAFMQGWEAAMNHYLSSGEMIE